MIKIRYFLLILLIVTSCANQKVVMYYYNGLNINNNSTWGSSLQIFFMENRDMMRMPIRDKNLKNEISIIKGKIISKNSIIVPDDGNYTFAFISKKDTLFADDQLEFWRYKDKGISYKLNDSSKNIILKHYKLNPNQQ
ncbi:hypothetical protein P2W68_03725 [Chryseobacterium arthrosphaerae]|uniref:hypothetical protein n=1 Tax=Chryseobacterium arthrosphaerae TaxID=651561 RepID=UPI0023E12C87|nr:hypothetical protein [Chryseobacterium arthrosphaerae]WES98724.1 hypothetical protein P2W68_03725 [Chryseobacterium arthrosphaerae]